MKPKSLELLEQVLSGQMLDSSSLDLLIADQVAEDLYIEYKHGNELANDKKPATTLRKYAAGFANAMGGLLIIGIDAPNRLPQSVTGCAGHDKGDLADWAARCLTPLHPFLSPPPRIQVIQHSHGEVLLIAAQRTYALVPAIENGCQVYFLRMGDQTLLAPEYLAADLLMGKRQQPSFGVSEFQATGFSRSHDKASMNLEVRLAWKLENTNLVWAEASRWGIVALVTHTTIQPGCEVGQPSQNLLAQINFTNPSIDTNTLPRNLLHIRGAANIDKPFDVSYQTLSVSIPLRVLNTWYTYAWKAAFYLVSRESIPIWHQIAFDIHTDTVKLADGNETLQSPHGISITQLVDERPIVAWERLAASE